ncbi:hypothetical protein PENANT_c061G04224 [Penicillium antarcticum]|uniref:Oxidoreductase n=1 Tax=Penicillium antarcticum TaxID=416450 RepID=A0A1V6PQ98_9EURO|nr:uncharacterized protein N7508_000458 [Penicillium antarcticum]KAJ5320175.1 hypothetical protein N7508_000458 [Penicillium antarcticum]OQD79133.1 hypothetical protein PENANT_c061G04224 [Penicillium antarcticum]
MPSNYNPETDVPDLTGKSIFITGGTNGLGATSAAHLANHNPSHIYISGRNETRAQETINNIKSINPSVATTFIKCDLTSLPSIKQAAESFTSQSPPPRLDILMCNAGIMAVSPGQTSDGYEIQFGTNHLGHALLIKKLLPTMQATSDDPRIVILTSQGWAFHPRCGIMFDSLKTGQNMCLLGPWQRYGQSKLANLLYARELVKRVDGVKVLAIHPGIVSTGLVDALSLKNRAIVYATAWWRFVKPEEGAFNQVWAATVDFGGRVGEEKGKGGDEGVVNGGYYEPVGQFMEKSLDSVALDKEGKLAARLWEWTEEALKGL